MTYPKPVLRRFAPRSYACKKIADQERVDFDALPFDPESSIWAEAAYTEDFVDIEGERKPLPRFRTRVKMRWSEEGIYFLAVMEGEEVWWTQTERDSVIFRDNDFEIFIDPDDDTHCYVEFEINAGNTVWDLLLNKPYRDGGFPLNSFDIKGLRSKTEITRDAAGEPVDWRAVILIPFASLAECTSARSGLPRPGDRFRLNFSRVHWNCDKIDGRYVKRKNEAGLLLPEENWVWSPQGIINMHYPEMWGCLLFCDEEGTLIDERSFPCEEDHICFVLRKLWYEEHEAYAKLGRYVRDFDFEEVLPEAAILKNLRIETAAKSFELSCELPDGRRLILRQDGRLERAEC